MEMEPQRQCAFPGNMFPKRNARSCMPPASSVDQALWEETYKQASAGVFIFFLSFSLTFKCFRSIPSVVSLF